MEPEDFVSPEVGITAAVVAVVASPRVRKVVRRGAVLGLAGILTAGDAITAFARGVGQGVSQQTQHQDGAHASDRSQEPAPEQGDGRSGAEPS
jgi:hypothetical protein